MRFGTSILGLACLLLAGGLAGCSGNGISGSAVTGTPPLLASGGKKKKFDPFTDDDGSPIGGREVIKNPTLAQVMQPGPLPEMALGQRNAPVTVIKYASLTCPYCRKFQTETFPQLKRQYIDTGKVRFILREFPIGFQSGAATIALRCVPANKYFALYKKFLTQQARWVSQEVRTAPILKIARQVGLTRAQYDSCRKDRRIIDGLKAVKDRGRTLGIIGTPNFFVNGKLYKRVLVMKDFHQIVSQSKQARTADRPRR